MGMTDTQYKGMLLDERKVWHDLLDEIKKAEAELAKDAGEERDHALIAASVREAVKTAEEQISMIDQKLQY